MVVSVNFSVFCVRFLSTLRTILSMAKLKQKRRALQTKTELLNKLDEEIVEMVPEDNSKLSKPT